MIKLSLLLMVFSSFAALPPVESLFRNGSNQDIEADSVILNFSVEEIKNSSTIDLSETYRNEEALYKGYFKIILNRNASGRVEMVQAEYKNSDMKNDSLVNLYEGSSFMKYLRYKKEISPEKDIFYGVLISLLLNNSKPISNFLSKTNSDFVSNGKVINYKKRQLFEDYKKYLQRVLEEKF